MGFVLALLSWIIAAAAGADRRHLSMACEL
jgi:hypothetical protein